MFTDSHCHLASHKYAVEEVPLLITRASDAGVDRLVTLATSLDDLDLNLGIASHPGVHTCVGIHPCDVHNAPDDACAVLSDHSQDVRVCAIGETGLDYYHPAPTGWTEAAYRERQLDFLDQHFQLAARARLNIVIHTRDLDGHASFEDALAIYRRHHENVRAQFHCFIGPWENAVKVLDLGGILSFGGVSTFKSAHLVRETAAKCPPGSFTLETDSPYLAPEPMRGKRNEPALIPHIAARLAALRDESPEELARHTNTAADRFFRFSSPQP